MASFVSPWTPTTSIAASAVPPLAWATTTTTTTTSGGRRSVGVSCRAQRGNENMPPPSVAGLALVVTASALVVPPLTAAVFAVCLVGFSYLGRTWIPDEFQDDDEEEEVDVKVPTDVLALGAAVATAGLLVPSTNSMDTTSTSLSSLELPVGILLFVLGGLLLADANPLSLGSASEESLSTEEQLMQLWDKELQRKNSKKDR